MNTIKDGFEMELFEIADLASVSWDNKLNLMGIFDEIHVKNLPAKHSKMYVAGIAKGKPKKEYEADITVSDPEGKPIYNIEMKFNPGENGKANLLAEVLELPINQLGLYSIQISNQKEVVDKRDLLVKRDVKNG